MAKEWDYLRPCSPDDLTPAEVEARVKEARRDALKEAWLVIANKSALETPASFEDILQRDIEMMNAIRALGEKE
jgi:hypothetical protein